MMVTSRKKTNEDFENFRSNGSFGNFLTNCNKLAYGIDLDPFRMKLKQEIEIAK